MAMRRKMALFFAVAVMLLLAATFHHAQIMPDGSVSLYRGAGKPRYIFVDLGANRADSLEAFLLTTPEREVRIRFPQALLGNARTDRVLTPLGFRPAIEIYLFEANPVFNAALVEAKERYTAQGKRVQVFPSTVADVADGTRTFYLDTVNETHDFWGSSTYANHGDVAGSRGAGTAMPAVDVARWLLTNALPRDLVVVKMDVEGAEYDLLPHFVEMGAWAVVDHLLVEWHAGLPSEAAGRAAAEALARLKAEGVNVPDYESPA
ncbi:FkbM family methyltransferase [Colletotrichum falcatum]|nr:FkbM family methyltransferase [Colletotrichum falcatum]